MPKTIILTGASRGIGRAIAEYLLREGHNVVAVARSQTLLEELQVKYPKQARYLAGDMTDFSLAKKVAEFAVKEFGKINGLIVNHAVVAPIAKIADTNVEDWRHMFDVNLFSAVALVEATMPELRKSRGCIIFTSTGAAIKSYKTMGVYGASKAALNHLGQTIGTEEPDITTLCIAPGVVDTEMQREMREDYPAMEKETHANFINLHNENKLLKPEVPGNVMARLVLDAPSELSGKALRWNAVELEAFQDK